jgi:multidrug efflux pump subunit AcrA (membrane-fusion protein)
LRLHVSLSENEIGAARTGDTVEIIVPSLGERTWTGTVSEVVPAVDPSTRTMLVKIDLPEDPALRSGLFARARFAAGEKDALRVPQSSLVRRGGMDGVFVVQDRVASFRLLQLAAGGSADAVEVLSGLRAGDRVVLEPPATLTEGATVEVQP